MVRIEEVPIVDFDIAGSFYLSHQAISINGNSKSM
jgi:hypothetical protein